MLMDVKILLKTVIYVVKGVGVGAPEQEIMHEFMGSKEQKRLEEN